MESLRRITRDAMATYEVLLDALAAETRNLKIENDIECWLVVLSR